MFIKNRAFEARNGQDETRPNGRTAIIAVGMPVARHPPHRSQRALLMHWAPTSDDWRRNAPADKDAEREGEESSGPTVG